MSIDHVARARALAGVRFRPQGRGPDALDCIGLVLSTFDIPAEAAPSNYSLRGDHRDRVDAHLRTHFRRVSKQSLRPGDVMLLQPRQRQAHLAIRTPAGFVHAHAGIGKVVETPGMPEWPLVAVYRKRRNR